MDALQVINAKTRLNLSIKKNRVGANPQGSPSKDGFLTDSYDSVTNFLQFVNRFFLNII